MNVFLRRPLESYSVRDDFAHSKTGQLTSHVCNVWITASGLFAVFGTILRKLLSYKMTLFVNSVYTRRYTGRICRPIETCVRFALRFSKIKQRDDIVAYINDDLRDFQILLKKLKLYIIESWFDRKISQYWILTCRASLSGIKHSRWHLREKPQRQFIRDVSGFERTWTLLKTKGRKKKTWMIVLCFFFSFFSTGTYVYFALSRNTSYSWKMRLQRPQAPRPFPLHPRHSALRAHSQSPFRLPSHRNAFTLSSPSSLPFSPPSARISHPASTSRDRHHKSFPPIPLSFPHHRPNVEQDNNYTCTYNYICALL